MPWRRHMHPCRRLCLQPISWGARTILFAYGYMWITEEFPEGTGACCGCGTRFPRDFNALQVDGGTRAGTPGQSLPWMQSRRGCQFCSSCECPYHSCFDACLWDGCCVCGYLRRRDIPRIVVGNHVTFLDALFMASRLIPTFVMQADIVNFPVIGAALGALQPILVPRTKEQAARLPRPRTQLVNRAQDPAAIHFPPVLLFPEGTTSHPGTVMQFQNGAFLPGRTVQPVALHYKWKRFDPTWSGDIGPIWLAWRCITTVYNTLHVQYLPPYMPCAEEAADPTAFARSVRDSVAAALGSATMDLSDKDSVLVSDLIRTHGLGNYALANILSTLGTRQAAYAVKQHYRDLAKLVSKFREADEDADGRINVTQFQQVMCAPMNAPGLDETQGGMPTTLEERNLHTLFALFDTDGDGYINYRELILGIATALGRNEAVDAQDTAITVSARSEEDSSPWSIDLDVPESVRAQLEIAFAVYDSNADGMVSISELTKVMLRLQLAAQASAAVQASVSSPGTSAREQESSSQVAPAEVGGTLPGARLAGTPLPPGAEAAALGIVQARLGQLLQVVDWGEHQPRHADGSEWKPGQPYDDVKLSFEHFVRLALKVRPLEPRAHLDVEEGGEAAGTDVPPSPAEHPEGPPQLHTRQDSLAEAWTLVVGSAVKDLHSQVGLSLPGTPRVPESARAARQIAGDEEAKVHPPAP